MRLKLIKKTKLWIPSKIESLYRTPNINSLKMNKYIKFKDMPKALMRKKFDY